MRLYHSHFFAPIGIRKLALAVWLGLLLVRLLAGCAAPQATQALIQVNLIADGQTLPIQVTAGSSVQHVLDKGGLSLGPLDRVEPAAYTVLSSGASIDVIRVTEKFEIEQETIPFERQTLRNESLTQDQQVLLQRGKNGVREITFRRVYEDGVEVASKPVAIRTTIVEEPQTEIIMIGIQAPFHPADIPGRLVYLRDGNVWIMEETTGNRRAVVTTGDLDGRVFSLSTDGNWLLFTRNADSKDYINSLWVANIGSDDEEQAGKLIDLKVRNVIHYADWVPGSTTKVVFSTVEPRATAPGWQANNDLNALTFSQTGWTTKWAEVLEPNSGGVYGWWGTSFSWRPEGGTLAFARPASVGLLDYKEGLLTTSVEIVPLQTRGDWAWVPGLAWGPDGKVLYTLDHVVPPGTAAPEESPIFDLMAISIETGAPLRLVSQAGMFAYPLTSPWQVREGSKVDYEVAYLQAIFPNQSDTSRYRLAIMDRDGSDRRILFPAEGTPGLNPQRDWGAWSPAPMAEGGDYALALIYQGNLWLVNAATGEAQQVTGDGLTSRVIWR